MKYNKNFYQIKSNETIFQRVFDERGTIGYYGLPDSDIGGIKKFAKGVTQKHIAVIGIGGSTLGTYAIYQFLNRNKTFEKNLHFFNQLTPRISR